MAHSKQFMERRAAGLCVDCGAPAFQGHLRCEKCLENQRFITAEYRKRKRREREVKTLEDTIKAATASGLSYGQYVAQNSEGMKWRIKKYREVQ